jgi:hypothetical protein
VCIRFWVLPRYAWFTNNLGTILPLFSGTFNLVLDFYSLRSKNQYNLGASSGHFLYCVVSSCFFQPISSISSFQIFLSLSSNFWIFNNFVVY